MIFLLLRVYTKSSVDFCRLSWVLYKRRDRVCCACGCFQIRFAHHTLSCWYGEAAVSPFIFLHFAGKSQENIPHEQRSNPSPMCKCIHFARPKHGHNCKFSIRSVKYFLSRKYLEVKLQKYNHEQVLHVIIQVIHCKSVRLIHF